MRQKKAQAKKPASAPSTVMVKRAPKRTAAASSVKPPVEIWGTKVAVVVATFNADITEKLAEGASAVFQKSGAQMERFDVPGAFEIAGVLSRLGRSRRYDGLMAIGCVVRGETEHYDLVVEQVREGVGRLSAAGDVPVTFGVLAVENRKQAQDRAGGKLGNLGAEAAEALLKLIPLYRRTAHPALVQPVAAHS